MLSRFPRILIVVAIASAVLLAQSFVLADEPSGLEWQTDLDKAWGISKDQQRPILLFVTCQGCAACVKMVRETYADENVLSTIGRSFVPTSIDASNRPEIVKKLNLQIYPTTLIIGPDAKVIDVVHGFVTPDILHLRLANLVAQRQATAR